MSHMHLELPAPGPLAPDALRVIPLGGLGEIGRNMTVFEFGGKLLIVDCGVLFPEENHPGVDLILPDFEPIRDRLDDVVGVVLTHGHEDHIGGVPFLLRERGTIPIVGSKLTLAFVEPKLKEHRLKQAPKHEVSEGDVLELGPFSCEFVAVNHSIPDALAVAITTPAGVVLHTGDFKMDQLPLDDRITDLRAFARLGEAGVDLFLTDSTNADVPGFTVPERDITPAIDAVFASSAQRVIVASFASHIHRVQQVLDAAHRHGRKVAYVGRSMVRNMQIARELGYLHVPDGVVVDRIDAAPPHEMVLMSTGSQGEPMAALSRIANNSHPQVSLEPGDTVLLASSLIPGNENAVYRVIDGLTKIGARVVHKGNALVHVSGHASAGELLYCYNIVRPTNVLPVHGEIRHLHANGALATKTGVPNVLLAEDGYVIDLVDGHASIVGAVDCGYVYVDGSSVGEITDSELKDRRILRDEGFISIVTVVDSTTGKIVTGPEIHARGLAEDESAFDEIVPKLIDALEQSLADGTRDTQQLQQVVRRVVGSYAGRRLRRRPMIIPIVLQA
ncbi:ribonuclease J [Aeromicrobium halocynthiae]|uniref:Ribonuclease J n=1 Tax=Aeromicrobium halocynthiae TaxID=560557 RepID=A0ABN2W090_9ACTN